MPGPAGPGRPRLRRRGQQRHRNTTIDTSAVCHHHAAITLPAAHVSRSLVPLTQAHGPVDPLDGLLRTTVPAAPALTGHLQTRPAASPSASTFSSLAAHDAGLGPEAALDALRRHLRRPCPHPPPCPSVLNVSSSHHGPRWRRRQHLRRLHPRRCPRFLRPGQPQRCRLAVVAARRDPPLLRHRHRPAYRGRVSYRPACWASVVGNFHPARRPSSVLDGLRGSRLLLLLPCRPRPPVLGDHLHDHHPAHLALYPLLHEPDLHHELHHPVRLPLLQLAVRRSP